MISHSAITQFTSALNLQCQRSIHAFPLANKKLVLWFSKALSVQLKFFLSFWPRGQLWCMRHLPGWIWRRRQTQSPAMFSWWVVTLLQCAWPLNQTLSQYPNKSSQRTTHSAHKSHKDTDKLFYFVDSKYPVLFFSNLYQPLLCKLEAQVCQVTSR